VIQQRARGLEPRTQRLTGTSRPDLLRREPQQCQQLSTSRPSLQSPSYHCVFLGTLHVLASIRGRNVVEIGRRRATCWSATSSIFGHDVPHFSKAQMQSSESCRRAPRFVATTNRVIVERE
jgi:hypothetical protein